MISIKKLLKVQSNEKRMSYHSSIFFMAFFFLILFEMSKACVRIKMQRYNSINLIMVNFSCYRRWLHPLLFYFKKDKSQLVSNKRYPESNLPPFHLRLSFLPLSHWDNSIAWLAKTGCDDWFFILSAGLPVALLFLFNCFLSQQSLEGFPAGFWVQNLPKKLLHYTFSQQRNINSAEKIYEY